MRACVRACVCVYVRVGVHVCVCVCSFIHSFILLSGLTDNKDLKDLLVWTRELFLSRPSGLSAIRGEFLPLCVCVFKCVCVCVCV